MASCTNAAQVKQQDGGAFQTDPCRPRALPDDQAEDQDSVQDKTDRDPEQVGPGNGVVQRSVAIGGIRGRQEQHVETVAPDDAAHRQLRGPAPNRGKRRDQFGQRRGQGRQKRADRGFRQAQPQRQRAAGLGNRPARQGQNQREQRETQRQPQGAAARVRRRFGRVAPGLRRRDRSPHRRPPDTGAHPHAGQVDHRQDQRHRMQAQDGQIRPGRGRQGQAQHQRQKPGLVDIGQIGRGMFKICAAIEQVGHGQKGGLRRDPADRI